MRHRTSIDSSDGGREEGEYSYLGHYDGGECIRSRSITLLCNFRYSSGLKDRGMDKVKELYFQLEG